MRIIQEEEMANKPHAVQILQTLNVPFESVNILEDEQLRSGMKEFSQWPTFPQVYINGEFYGGCDIMIGVHPFTRCLASLTVSPACAETVAIGLAAVSLRGPCKPLSSACLVVAAALPVMQ